MPLPFYLQHLPLTDSTMLDIDRLGREGALEGTVIWADEQNRGVGRGDHTWISVPAAGLEFSLLLRPQLPPDRLGGLSIEAGLAMAEAIEEQSSLAVQLKWPNDLWIRGLKVGGILLRSMIVGERTEFVNLGIGVNVNSPAGTIPELATSLTIETGAMFDRSQLLTGFWARFSRRYLRYREQPEVDVASFEQRAVWLGMQVTLDREPWQGTFTGIDSGGAAMIESAGQIVRVFDGTMTSAAPNAG